MRHRRKIKRKRKRAITGWLNRYDFAYAGGDTVNTGVTIFKKKSNPP